MTHSICNVQGVSTRSLLEDRHFLKYFLKTVCLVLHFNGRASGLFLKQIFHTICKSTCIDDKIDFRNHMNFSNKISYELSEFISLHHFNMI